MAFRSIDSRDTFNCYRDAADAVKKDNYTAWVGQGGVANYPHGLAWSAKQEMISWPLSQTQPSTRALVMKS